MKVFIITILLSIFTSSEVWAQMCFPNQGPGFVTPSPNYSGGHFQNQSLLAPAQAYQPQEYYFPQGNVQLSQPQLFGGGMQCQPGFMNQPFQTSFGQGQMQRPSFSNMALPYVGQGLTSLADYFENRPTGRGQSYDEFMADRGSSSSRGRSRRDNSDYVSPDMDGGPEEVPDSNSAGGGTGGRSSSSEESDVSEDDESNEAIEDENENEDQQQNTETETETETEEEDNSSPEDEVTGEDFTEPDDDSEPDQDSKTPNPPEADLHEDIAIQLDELKDKIDEPLTKADCLNFIREETLENSPLEGAYRVMATFYQDCESIAKIINKENSEFDLGITTQEDAMKNKTRSLKDEDREKYFSEHPYLKGREFEQESDKCRDLTQAPPMFSFGAKPRYKGGAGGDINLFRNQADSEVCQYSNIACESPPVTALDCSGFIHASLKASGLKMKKGADEAPHYSTIGFNDLAMKEDSCFEKTRFSAENTLAPGDIVSKSNHHMFMISSVGEDPLGVEKAVDSGDCSSISRDDFNFTFIQSGADKDLGVAHISSDYPEASLTVFNNLWSMAKKACQKALNGEEHEAMTKDGSSSTVVMRHVGNEDPACVEESKPKLEGEECVEDCLNES